VVRRSGRRRTAEGEVGEVESRDHDAADQDGLLHRSGRLPGTGRHQQLRALARFQVGAEHELGDLVGLLALTAEPEPQGAAAVVEPELVGGDLVPGRGLSRPEQEVDRRAQRSGAGVGLDAVDVPVGLGVPAALGVREQVEGGSPVG